VSQLIRYGVIAGCGYLLAIAIYSGELAIGIAPYLALGIAFGLNALFNFALIRLWHFLQAGEASARISYVSLWWLGPASSSTMPSLRFCTPLCAWAPKPHSGSGS
jgi:putative flippase GtrA